MVLFRCFHLYPKFVPSIALLLTMYGPHVLYPPHTQCKKQKQFKFDHFKGRGIAIDQTILSTDGKLITSKSGASSSSRHGRVKITSSTGFNRGVIRWKLKNNTKTRCVIFFSFRSNFLSIVLYPAHFLLDVRCTHFVRECTVHKYPRECLRSL